MAAFQAFSDMGQTFGGGTEDNAQMEAQAKVAQTEAQRRQRERLSLLREEAAARRADFGAMGISSDSGSARALIDGLAVKAYKDIDEDSRDLSARLDAIRRPRRNILASGKQGMETAQQAFQIFQSFYGNR